MDVHDPARGLFGRCEPKISNQAVDALLSDVMTSEPYASARRVFWVVDDATIHRGHKSVARLQGAWPSLVLVHLPRHASWLNQIEIYFSILARKALTPAYFHDTTSSPTACSASKPSPPRTAQPFHWTFTRQDLHALLDRLDQHDRLAPAA